MADFDRPTGMLGQDIAPGTDWNSRDEVAAALGHGLTAIRVQGGLSQRELAQARGVRPTAVSQAESGDTVPSLPVIAETANVFNQQPLVILVPTSD